jgi:4-diphosphocytidyl-2-C-methyl-D-erythritol kinase
MIVFPVSKINLGLNITSKRGDGYHDIETVFYPVPLCDALEFVCSDNNPGKDLFVATGINTGGANEDNLVLKTVRKLREKYTIPYLRIHLHKAIPAGAGLGGGSSDSACFLRILNRFFKLDIPVPEMKRISLEIGSDCPFFIEGVPAYATGRGEKLNSVDPVLSGYHLVLLNPGVGINTREAYQNCIPHTPKEVLAQLIKNPLERWKESVFNDFEAYAFSKYPVIGQIKNKLYNAGAIFSLMSGSGSTVYGIFSAKPTLPEELRRYVIFEGRL